MEGNEGKEGGGGGGGGVCVHTLDRDGRQEFEVLEDAAVLDQNEVDAPVCQMGEGRQAQRGPIAPAGAHNRHDTLVPPRDCLPLAILHSLAPTHMQRHFAAVISNLSCAHHILMQHKLYPAKFMFVAQCLDAFLLVPMWSRAMPSEHKEGPQQKAVRLEICAPVATRCSARSKK